MKRYGRRRVVDGLELNVPAGSIYALLGANGAGKTTTLRMLLGLTRPSRGTVTLLGQDALRQPKAREGVGGMIDAPAFYPNLTGWENLSVYASALRVRRARLAETLEIVGLTEAAHRRAGTYSLGMRQRLGIALALLGKPSVLILDEPQNGLDPTGMREMRTLLCELQGRSHTLLISSHLLAEVERFATHTGLIANGRMVFEGTLQELQAHTKPRLKLEVNDPQKALEALRPWLNGQPPQQEGRELILLGADYASEMARAVVYAGLELHRLEPLRPSLEQAFMALTVDVTEVSA
jgi:ABC-2 type transport system ATP-binding protein